MRYPKPINLTANEQAQFHRLVDRPGEEPNICWEWRGTFFDSGYGEFISLGRSIGAHRAAFWIEHRRQPAGLVLHSCDNPACCRPSHLFEGTHKDNMRDCVSKGRCRSGTNPNPNRLTPEQKQRVIESKTRAKVLARELGCSIYNIYRIRREHANSNKLRSELPLRESEEGS